MLSQDWFAWLMAHTGKNVLLIRTFRKQKAKLTQLPIQGM